MTWPDAHESGPQRLLALGGCTISTISSYLQRYAFTRHYWRQNIVCDMSALLDMRNIQLADAHAVRVIDKYAGKFHKGLIEKGEFDWLLLECAADHVFQYLRVDDAVIPDLRNDLFKAEWADLSFDGDPVLGRAEPLSAADPLYWVIWKQSFARLYEDILLPHIQGGKKVIFVRRYMCLQFVDEFGRHYFEDMDIPKQNDVLRDVYAFLDGFDGMIFIDPPEELLNASQYAPWGGPSVLHPEQEFYHFVVEDILRKCASAELADIFRREVMAAGMEERVRYAFQADYARALSQQHGEHLVKVRDALWNETLGDATLELDDGDMWAKQIGDLKAELEERTLQASRAEAERDSLALQMQSVETAYREVRGRLAKLEQRFAPLRRLYAWRPLKKSQDDADLMVGTRTTTPWNHLPSRQIIFAIAFTQLDELFQVAIHMFPSLQVA